VEFLRGRGADNSDRNPADLLIDGDSLHEIVHGVGAGEHQPLVRIHSPDGLIDGRTIFDRLQLDGGTFDDSGPKLGESFGQITRGSCGTRRKYCSTAQRHFD